MGWYGFYAVSTLYLTGASPPIVLHAVLTLPVTGDLRPGFLHTELGGGTRPVAVALAPLPAPEDLDDAAVVDHFSLEGHRASVPA
jgi:hypothetical protein